MLLYSKPGKTGDQGETGDPGLPADMTRASTTSLVIGTGSKTLTFTTPSPNLAWAIGARLRLVSASDVTKSMDGSVTSIASSGGSSTGVTLNVDSTRGSGTYADWNIVVVGEPSEAAGPSLKRTASPDASTPVDGTRLTFDFDLSAYAYEIPDTAVWLLLDEATAAVPTSQFTWAPKSGGPAGWYTLTLTGNAPTDTLFAVWQEGVQGQRGPAGTTTGFTGTVDLVTGVALSTSGALTVTKRSATYVNGVLTELAAAADSSGGSLPTTTPTC